MSMILHRIGIETNLIECFDICSRPLSPSAGSYDKMKGHVSLSESVREKGKIGSILCGIAARERPGSPWA